MGLGSRYICIPPYPRRARFKHGRYCFYCNNTGTELALLCPGVLLAIGFGSTGTAWQGVYLAEVARKAPEGRVVEATSGCMTATFLGGLVGPGVAAALTIISGNLADGFIFIGAVTLLFGLLFLRKAKHRFD